MDLSKSFDLDLLPSDFWGEGASETPSSKRARMSLSAPWLGEDWNRPLENSVGSQHVEYLKSDYSIDRPIFFESRDLVGPDLRVEDDVEPAFRSIREPHVDHVRVQASTTEHDNEEEDGSMMSSSNSASSLSGSALNLDAQGGASKSDEPVPPRYTAIKNIHSPSIVIFQKLPGSGGFSIHSAASSSKTSSERFFCVVRGCLHSYRFVNLLSF